MFTIRYKNPFEDCRAVCMLAFHFEFEVCFLTRCQLKMFVCCAYISLEERVTYYERTFHSFLRGEDRQEVYWLCCEVEILVALFETLDELTELHLLTVSFAKALMLLLSFNRDLCVSLQDIISQDLNTQIVSLGIAIQSILLFCCMQRIAPADADYIHTPSCSSFPSYTLLVSVKLHFHARWICAP